LLARQHHPDLNPDDPEAAARFRLIAAAFEAVQAARAQARAKGRSLRGAANYRQPQFTDKAEVFEEFFGISEDGSPLSWSPGADFRYDLEISLVSAIRGMWTVIRVDQHPNCRPCGGTGLAAGTGTGSVRVPGGAAGAGAAEIWSGVRGLPGAGQDCGGSLPALWR
jgi:molecular chaperone DnaJ